MNVRGLARSLREQGQSPCENGCSNTVECAEQQLSCLAFSRYLENGQRIQRMPADIPTRAIYDRQLSDEPDLQSLAEFNRLRASELLL